MRVDKVLIPALVNESKEVEVWSLQPEIFREHAASIALHKGIGFREIGFQKRKGTLDGVWRDALLLERRSQIVVG